MLVLWCYIDLAKHPKRPVLAGNCGHGILWKMVWLFVTARRVDFLIWAGPGLRCPIVVPVWKGGWRQISFVLVAHIHFPVLRSLCVLCPTIRTSTSLLLVVWRHTGDKRSQSREIEEGNGRAASDWLITPPPACHEAAAALCKLAAVAAGGLGPSLLWRIKVEMFPIWPERPPLSTSAHIRESASLTLLSVCRAAP